MMEGMNRQREQERKEAKRGRCEAERQSGNQVVRRARRQGCRDRGNEQFYDSL